MSNITVAADRPTKRMVIITIDTLVELFKDYLGPEQLPTNAQPVAMLINPKEKGKIMIIVDSDDILQDVGPLRIDFHLKRFFGVTAAATEAH